MKSLYGLCLLTALCAGCEGSDTTRPPLTREELLDPESCKDCHPKHYTEWSASMHAYALEDPVFEAMNRRGQEEAELGQFCVNCHAPMAVREDAFKGDFADLDQVPKHLRGVTCYFCHQVTGVERLHNAGLELTEDGILRGGFKNPVQPWAHEAAYSELHDRTKLKSTEVCGACHDIVTPAGVELERTYKEYVTTVFAHEDDAFQSCQDCHMESLPSREVVAVYDGVRARARHSHLFPAVDVPLTDFPHREAMVTAVERLALPQSIGYFAVETSTMDARVISAKFETQAGHAQPSGAAQDRRMWLEVRAFNEDGSLRYESGVIDDCAVEEVPEGMPGHDPDLCMLRDRLYDTEDPDDPEAREVHMFWEARSVKSALVPPPTSVEQGSHTFTCGEYALRNREDLNDTSRPARITFRLRIRPMGMDVLQDLVDSGHLDESIPCEVPTFTLFESEAVPNPDDPFGYIASENRVPVDQHAHLCMLHDEYCED